jgi:hypothetical protein
VSSGKEVARILDAREREAEVLKLRRDGLTYDVIARRLGYSSPSGAHQAFQRAMARITQEPAEEVRRLELERLDYLWECLAPAIAKGRGYAIEKALMIQDRRARLLGLDAPTKHQVQVSDQVTAEIEALANDLGILDAEVVEDDPPPGPAE